MNALPKLQQKRGSMVKTTPSLRRASTRSSLSEGGSPLPAKCIDIAVGGETIIVAELENRYWLETVNTLARNSSSASYQSLGCSLKQPGSVS